jgi:hypothetical protein
MFVEPPDSGVKRIVVEENGRARRCKMEAIVGIATIVRRKSRNFVSGFRLTYLYSEER